MQLLGSVWKALLKLYIRALTAFQYVCWITLLQAVLTMVIADLASMLPR